MTETVNPIGRLTSAQTYRMLQLLYSVGSIQCAVSEILRAGLYATSTLDLGLSNRDQLAHAIALSVQALNEIVENKDVREEAILSQLAGKDAYSFLFNEL